jgi:hypothetical protein
MGELNIGITDLAPCTDCGYNNPLIFQVEKDETWWIACGYRRCEHKTEHYAELLDAADAWGLRSAEYITG